VILIPLMLAGCASQVPEPVEEVPDIQVFLEEPGIAYESLGRVDETSRAEHPADVLNIILRRAATLGADGVIVHSVRNEGRVARGNDIFGTGGRNGYSVYQIQATVIRYTE
jgi:hypothetical protein